MFSIYSTSPVGVLGAIVEVTEVAGVLKLDCNATDFYSYPSYPVYLLYNPYQEEKELRYEVSFEKTICTILSPTIY